MKSLFVCLIVTIAYCIPASVCAQTWIPVGSPKFSPGVANYTNIAIGTGGTPYVCYSDSLNHYAAMVQKFTGGRWDTVGFPDFSAGEADFITMTIDGSGTPYVAYTDYGNGAKATVMKFDGTSWVNVGSAGLSDGMALFTSITTDKSGTPYIFYSDYNDRARATVKKFDGTSWVTVGTSGFSKGGSDHTSIAINSTGTPYVAYCDTAMGYTTVVMQFDGTNWVQVDTVDAGYTTSFNRILIAPDNTPYLAYTDYSAMGGATVMKFNGSKWIPIGSRGFSGHTAFYISLALDTTTTTTPTPYVAFQDFANNQKAHVMKYDGKSWITVGNTNISDSFAYYTSVAMDKSGTLYLAYSDQGNRPGAYGPITVRKLALGESAATIIDDNIMSIFPNPASAKIDISSTGSIAYIAVTNVQGRIVYNATCSGKHAQVDVAALQPGIYFININGTHVQQFVKE